MQSETSTITKTIEDSNVNCEIFSPKSKMSQSVQSNLSINKYSTEQATVDVSCFSLEPYEQIKLLVDDLPTEKLQDLIMLLKKKLKKQENTIQKDSKFKSSEITTHYSKNAIATYNGKIEDIRNKSNVIEANEVNGKVVAKFQWDKRKVFSKISDVLKIDGCEVLNVEPIRKRNKPYLSKINMSGVIQSSSTRGKAIDNWWECLLEDAQTVVSKNLDDFCASVLEDVNADFHIGVNEDVIAQSVTSAVKKIKPAILGTNYLMSEKILGKEITFKVDFFFIKSKTLHVFEYKVRNDRNKEEENAYKCLRYKKYAERLINFLKLIRPDTLLDVSQVIEYGLAFSNNTISMMSKTRTLSQINLTGYQTNEFLSAMKRNKRRFKNK